MHPQNSRRNFTRALQQQGQCRKKVATEKRFIEDQQFGDKRNCAAVHRIQCEKTFLSNTYEGKSVGVNSAYGRASACQVLVLRRLDYNLAVELGLLLTRRNRERKALVQGRRVRAQMNPCPAQLERRLHRCAGKSLYQIHRSACNSVFAASILAYPLQNSSNARAAKSGVVPWRKIEHSLSTN